MTMLCQIELIIKNKDSKGENNVNHKQINLNAASGAKLVCDGNALCKLIHIR